MLRKELGLTTQQTAAMFAYLFRRIDNKRFRELIPNGMHFKKRMDKSGYILKNCKLFSYANWRAVQEGTPLPKARDYGVSPKDSPLLRKLNLAHIPAHYPTYTLVEFDTMVSQYLASKELNTFIGKFISKKMTFLIKSYGEERKDITGLLQEAALYAIYRKYPFFESYEHFKNVGHTAIKNTGQSFISQRTSDKNQRLMRNDDGTFEHRHVPLDAIESALAAEPLYRAEHILGEIRNVVPLAPKARKFLKVVSGAYDEDFSAYLGADNSEVVDTMRHDSYVSKVQKFFGVTPDQVSGLYKKIRERMAL